MDESAFGGDAVAKKEHDDFYIAYGRAMARWANVEHALHMIYLTTTMAHHWLPHSDPRVTEADHAEMAHRITVAASAYFSIINWNTRLGMVDSVIASQRFSVPLADQWTSLKNRAIRRSKRRNSLAHWVVRYSPHKASGTRFSLIEDLSDPAVRANPREVHTADLIDLEKQFAALANELANFESDAQGELQARLKASGKLGVYR